MTATPPTDLPVLREADREYVWETLRRSALTASRQEKALRAFDRILDQIEDDEELLSDAQAALKTLGFTDPTRIEWLAEGLVPGTWGWAAKVMQERKEKAAS